MKCTAAELAEMGLPGLPTSKSAILKRAKDEEWQWEEVKGIGGTHKLFTVPEPYFTAGSGNAVEETRQRYDLTQTARDTLGKPVDISEFVFVPRYDVAAAAGHGSTAIDAEPMFTMAFRKYWVINHLHADPKDLAVVSVTGESMAGVLNPKDVILINMADSQPVDGIYVIRLDGDLLVKHIGRGPGGLIVSSANSAYGSWTVDPRNPPQDFAVIGRVVWFARQM